MHQKRARKYQLLDFEFLERVKQPPRSLHGHGVILRVLVSGRIVVGGEMDDRGDPTSCALANIRHCRDDALVGCQVDRERIHAVDRLSRPPRVKTYDAVALEQASRDRLSEEAAAAGDEDGRTAHL